MAGSVKYIKDSEFQGEVLAASSPVLLDFTAVWCGPCKAIAPHLESLQVDKGAAMKVVKMDIDQNPETPNRFGVQSIPTLLLFKEGKVVGKHVGSLNRAQLDAFVAKAL